MLLLPAEIRNTPLFFTNNFIKLPQTEQSIFISNLLSVTFTLICV